MTVVMLKHGKMGWPAALIQNITGEKNSPQHKTITINFLFTTDSLVENNYLPKNVQNKIAVPLAMRLSEKLQSRI